MFQLDDMKKKELKSLLNKDNSHYPLLKLILANKKKGRAYVDCIASPATAAIVSDDGWFYLIGESNNDYDFNSQLENFLLRKVNEENQNILWFGISNKWRSRLSNNSVAISEYPRVQYRFIESKFSPYSVDNPEYALKKIFSDNIDEVFNYCKGLYSFWENKELFLKNGLGFILLDGSKIIGHAISASVEDQEVEFDIQTDGQYRGKGIARFLASELIKECLSRSLVPKWDCAVGNIPSNKLALKLGFDVIKEYRFCIITAK